MAVDFFTVGQRIQKRRKMLHKTQEQMAEALSVTVGYISQIERGVTKISLDTLSEITEYLDCNFSQLLDGSTMQSDLYLKDEIKLQESRLSPVNKRILSEIADVLEKKSGRVKAFFVFRKRTLVFFLVLQGRENEWTGGTVFDELC